MNPTLQLVLAVLESLAVAAGNSALGLDGAKVARVLGFVIALGKAGESAHYDLAKLADDIRALEASGAPIPPATWDEWDARLDAAHARLQALKPPADPPPAE